MEQVNKFSIYYAALPLRTRHWYYVDSHISLEGFNRLDGGP
jgi:hypothetical protein